MICRGVANERKLGCNICFLYSGVCLCVHIHRDSGRESFDGERWSRSLAQILYTYLAPMPMPKHHLALSV